MGMSGVHGAADEAESIATAHAALEAGATLIDTGGFYAMGHNELAAASARGSPVGTWNTASPSWRLRAGSPRRRGAPSAIAGVATRSDDIVPLAGARTRERLAEALPAMELDLTADDLAGNEKAVPPGAARGDRYPAALMSGLGVGN